MVLRISAGLVRPARKAAAATLLMDEGVACGELRKVSLPLVDGKHLHYVNIISIQIVDISNALSFAPLLLSLESGVSSRYLADAIGRF